MIKYVFEYYSDKKSFGEEVIFDTFSDARKYMRQIWFGFTPEERQSLIEEHEQGFCLFHIYKIELSEEQLQDYFDGNGPDYGLYHHYAIKDCANMFDFLK